MRALLLALLLLVGPSGAGAAVGRHGMVSSEHGLASQAGLEILRRGGNAVDAAVATALVVGVVNPSSCGIGGGGFMLVFDRRTDTVAALDYRETAPAGAGRDMFVRGGEVLSELSLFGGLAVAVPGEIAGLHAALARFGTLPFAEVAAPAITLARDGFPIEEHLANAIEHNRERILRNPGLAAILLRPDGTPPAVGDVLRQPDLATTLGRIVAGGPRVFYEGEIAEAIARSAQASGGVLTAADLRHYAPVWREPLRGRFAGAEVWGMPPPSSGGGVVLEILQILARDRLEALGHNSPTYVHLLTEAMRFAFADRAKYYGDPDRVAVPLGDLLSPARARRRRHRLSAATSFSTSFYGNEALAGDHGTSHLSVVDAEGNAVACTTSINTSFGSMVVGRATGVILNNTMDDFSVQPGTPNVYGLVGSEANAVAPGKRPLSSMTPTIVTRDRAPVVVAGASGGPLIITATLQAVLNVLVFDLDAAAAVAAPRFHHQWTPPALIVEPGIPWTSRQPLPRLGHRVVERPGLGAVQLIRRTADGRLEGAADPRKGGRAAGW